MRSCDSTPALLVDLLIETTDNGKRYRYDIIGQLQISSDSRVSVLFRDAVPDLFDI